jgi:hypothetical protein
MLDLFPWRLDHLPNAPDQAQRKQGVMGAHFLALYFASQASSSACVDSGVPVPQDVQQ